MNLTSTKAYGALVVVALLVVWLWTSWDVQAGMHHPGWFAGLRRNVWCQTVLVGPEFETAMFFHYPGKRLSRLMDELNVPPRYQELYRHADEQATSCYPTWKAAAEKDMLFYSATKDYPDILADWTEEDYQQAMLLLHLQPRGLEQLETSVRAERRLKAQEAGQ